MIENVIIIGGGPSALTCGIYTGRAELNPIIFEGFMAGGIAAGGQLTLTTTIENFPGFAKPIQATELVGAMRTQAIENGCRIETQTIASCDLKGEIKKVITESGKVYEAKVVIIATGSIAKQLGIENKDKFWNSGISACAVCDGALPIFRNGSIYVIGGGDTAVEESVFLTKFAQKVYLLVRKDKLRASKAMQNKLLSNEKIEVCYNTEILKADGEKTLKSLTIVNNITNEKREVPANGLFFAIGHSPNTEFLNKQLDTDEIGYILTKNNSTSLDGVFACGDVCDKIYRQAITAAGDGAKAAIEAIKYLENVS